MKTIMSLRQLTTLAAIEQFLAGTQEVAFSVATSKKERYRWIQKTLVQHNYLLLSKADKGTITRYLMKVTSYSRAQTKRLIQQYSKTGTVKVRLARRNGFKRAYTEADIRLLATMDERHSQPSGAVLKKLCERAFKRFGQVEYQQLAGISVAHLYNLRVSKTYQRQRCTLTKTRPRTAPIGQRRKPCPNNQPGYVRIDSVHQGDQDKRKGIYHINAVDEVTQFQVVFTLERISEVFMLPALNRILASFPFKIRGFHADNGGEYINYTVAELLEKLHIEFTKSRPRHSNDNGLVESKNGSVVRKLYGYMHIPQHYADDFSALNSEQVYRYINFHRPCYFPTTVMDDKGKSRKQYLYQDMMTPYEKLLSLPRPSQYLKPGETIKKLNAFATEMTDNEAAEQMNSARDNLFQQLHERLKSRA
ncbi:MAG TPA: transposase [Gammaproteobacteria bacterium]|nr:transposase [Gammaproteobacteria bacterium]